MTALPDPLNSIEQRIYATYEANAEPPRPHLGVSQIGHVCDRALWLSYRWAVKPHFPGRMLKLFKFGHEYEDTVIRELRAIGCKIVSRQGRVDFGAGVSGSCDGIISNVPGREKQTLLLEIKTLSDKSFIDLKKKGVEVSKPIYWVQIHCYMLGLKLERCLFYALNKNTSEIYTEIVKFDPGVAEKAIERAKKIALCERLPEPISSDPSWYVCKSQCSFHNFCFTTQITDTVSCRNCCHVTPDEDGNWLCARNDNAAIPVEFQHSGCDQHVLHPDLVPWQMAPNDNANEATYIINDVHVRNGEPDAFVYSSKEIIADPVACTIQDETVELLRANLQARIQEPEINF